MLDAKINNEQQRCRWDAIYEESKREQTKWLFLLILYWVSERFIALPKMWRDSLVYMAKIIPELNSLRVGNLFHFAIHGIE